MIDQNQQGLGEDRSIDPYHGGPMLPGTSEARHRVRLGGGIQRSVAPVAPPAGPMCTLDRVSILEQQITALREELHQAYAALNGRVADVEMSYYGSTRS